MKTDHQLAGAGLLTALAASLCCITPVLAVIAGIGGGAASFSWMEPARPYLVGFSVLLLGWAWYRKLRPSRPSDCCNPNPAKKNFTHSKTFLGILTLFTVGMLTFPLYAPMLFPKPTHQAVVTDTSNMQTVEFGISGMSCSACEEEVNHQVQKLPGIIRTITSYDHGNAVVVFDDSKTSSAAIAQAIRSTGYQVTTSKLH